MGESTDRRLEDRATAGLRVICASDFHEVRLACDTAVKDLASAGVPCTRVFPTADRAKAARRRLADESATAGGERIIPTLGVGVTTLPAWAQERWALFGDGRRLVSSGQRRALVSRAVERAALAPAVGSSALDLTAPGLVGCLESLVRPASGLPALVDSNAALPEGLSGAQLGLVHLARSYLASLSDAGLVEPGTAAALLPGLMGSLGWEHLVFEGIGELDSALCDLLVQAAAHAGVTIAVHADAQVVRAACEAVFTCGVDDAVADDPASAYTVRLVAGLARRCRDAGVSLSVEEASASAQHDAPRSPELDGLASRLFKASGPDVVPLGPTGAVRFLLPAGRYAEPTALAEEIIRLRDELGIAPGDMILASRDPLATASDLAGRLVDAGVSCWARGMVPLALTQAGRALMGLARLVDAEMTPAEDPIERAKQARPDLRPIASDLALNPLLGVGSPRAEGEKPQNMRQLDRQWRQRRATSASDLLDDLAAASPDVAGPAVAAVRAGDLLEAAQALRQTRSHGAPDDAWLCESAALKLAKGLLEAAGTDTGESNALAGSRSHAATSRSLVDQLAGLFQGACVPCSRLYAPQPTASEAPKGSAESPAPQDPSALLRIVRLADVEGMRARAVIVADLTAEAYPLSERDDVVSRLLDALGAGSGASAADRLRHEFAGAVEAASEILVLERRLHGVDAEDLRPSALFEDVVDCYRPDVTDLDDLDKSTGLPKDGSLPCDGVPGEDSFNKLIEPATPRPAEVAEFDVPELLTGTAASTEPLLSENPDLGEPVLSPTALEKYISCPARWFFEKNLPSTEGIDAQFDARVAGTFCHEVLQRVHERMRDEGMPRLAPSTTPDEYDLVDRLVEECFHGARREFAQAALADRSGDGLLMPSDCLVAIDEAEERSFARYLRQLKSCVRRDKWIPEGFAPRAFEQKIGFSADETPVYYAGVRLRGKIDRIDVDDRGRALVIDYKGTIAPGVYSPKPDGKDDVRSAVVLPTLCQLGVSEADEGGEVADPLPFHSQALIYASALRSLGYEPVGALYMTYRKPDKDHLAFAGFIDESQRDILLKSAKSADLNAGLYVPPYPEGSPERDALGASGWGALLKYTEGQAAEAVGRMRDGDIGPRPRFGAKSCKNCPLAATCAQRVM